MSQHDWLEKDFYKVLGVAKDADEKEITKKYRKLARKYHPDANAGDEKAEDKFKSISAAYDIVGDSDKRKEYDEMRRLGPASGFGGFNPGAGGGAGRNMNFDNLDLGDLLGGVFGRGGAGQGGRGAQQRANPATAGDDLESRLHLSFEDAVNGVTTSVHVISDAACGTCKGSGAKPGTTPTTCSRCGGRGVLDENQGMFSLSQPCPQCGGRGKIITDKCGTCRGTGLERKTRQVKLRVPAGVKNGQKIRLKGRGGPGRHGGPHGDLFVIIDVAAHKVFARKGKNLTVQVPISFSQAVLGDKIKAPTLDGKTVTLKMPAGTPSGKTFRVKGRGVTSKSSTGDLLVTVEVLVPSSLTDEQREAVEALDVALGRPAAPTAPPNGAPANGSSDPEPPTKDSEAS